MIKAGSEAMEKDRMVNKKSIVDIYRTIRHSLLFDISIMIICCVAGVFAKKLINPFANMITDAIHIPGGISTAVSLCFLVIARGITTRKWSASVMGASQALVAIAIGSFGSMGILMPFAYVVPGIVIDLVMLIPENGLFLTRMKAFLANILSSVSAALFADIVVFHLPLQPLLVYLGVSALSGAICGFAAGIIIESFNKLTRGDESE